MHCGARIERAKAPQQPQAQPVDEAHDVSQQQFQVSRAQFVTREVSPESWNLPTSGAGDDETPSESSSGRAAQSDAGAATWSDDQATPYVPEAATFDTAPTHYKDAAVGATLFDAPSVAARAPQEHGAPHQPQQPARSSAHNAHQPISVDAPQALPIYYGDPFPSQSTKPAHKQPRTVLGPFSPNANFDEALGELSWAPPPALQTDGGEATESVVNRGEGGDDGAGSDDEGAGGEDDERGEPSVSPGSSRYSHDASQAVEAIDPNTKTLAQLASHLASATVSDAATEAAVTTLAMSEARQEGLGTVSPHGEQALTQDLLLESGNAGPTLVDASSALRASGESGLAGFFGDGAETDEWLNDIETGFERMVSGSGQAQDKRLTRHEAEEVHALFAGIAADHTRPLRDLMMEVKLGEPPVEWVDLVSPSLKALARAAEGVELEQVKAATEVLLDVLSEIGASGQQTITSELAEPLEQAFELLAEQLPEAFALDEERDRSEPIMVQSLLRQVPGVRKVALDKLYAAGLTSLGMYYAAKPYDIAEAAGISQELASSIVDRFARHRAEVSEARPDIDRTREYAELAQLTDRLDKQNAAFEHASSGWTRDATKRKKTVRRERQDTLLQVQVMLARLGQAKLVEQLEPMPFRAKVAELRALLQRANKQREQQRELYREREAMREQVGADEGNHGADGDALSAQPSYENTLENVSDNTSNGTATDADRNKE